MCSDFKYLSLVFLLLAVSCSPYLKMKRIMSGEVGIGMYVPEDEPEEDECEEITIDSIRSTLAEGPVIMNAIRDTETGEMVATDVINASRVVARFRNVAERLGRVTIGFDIVVPSAMSDSRWQIKMHPVMHIAGDTLSLEPVYITGSAYRARQLRGYERYRAFLASIITDTTAFIRIHQLEMFLERHFPETYRMKNDPTLIPEPLAENLFGVTQRQALEHYTRHLKVKWNERRKSRKDRMYGRYVKDPIRYDGVRLDTILMDTDGDFIYRYEHSFRSRPKLRKVDVILRGSMYEDGECIARLPFPDSLTFYISSLSALADDRPKYRMLVLERTVYDNTKAFIDFEQGSAAIDTAIGDNASELRRLRRCIDDMRTMDEFALDSLVIMASCSPEGAYDLNRRLSEARSRAVLDYFRDFVPEEWKESMKYSICPENWKYLALLVANDTVIDRKESRRIADMIARMENPDKTEREMSRMKGYRYMREKLYPRLRTVSFDFYMHRIGMVKDTVHTTEIDEEYMSGLAALKELDYKQAVSILRPYRDYNSALAFLAADYTHSAWDVLQGLSDDSRVCYLKAVALSRLGQVDEALKYFELCVKYDPYMEYRANLDPEMHAIVERRKTIKTN